MEETKQTAQPRMRPPKPRSISIPRIRSEEDFHPSTPLTPGRQKTIKIYQIDHDALNKYKSILQKRVAWAFILLFLVIMERIFSDYSRENENLAIIAIQKFFGVEYENSNWLLQPIKFLENDLYFFLIMTHFFVILYYFYNVLVSLKIMFVTFNVMSFIALLEIIFSDPRPYWDHEQIVGIGCVDSYSFPSFNTFCIIFIFLYSWHCFEEEENDDDEEAWEKEDYIKCGVFILIFSIFCFLKILSGFDYFSQVVLSALYAVLFYYVAIFFDKNLTNLVEKSSMDIQSAKRYSIYWMIYILMFVGVCTLIYGASDNFSNMNWYSNYFNCLERQKETEVLKDTPYYHLIGAWGSLLKTSVMFAFLGTVFAATKVFADLKTTDWFSTTTNKKSKMTAFANLCLLPSWVIVALEPNFLPFLEQEGIDAYVFNALHFTILYFILFGLLPGKIFEKWRLLNEEPNYYLMDDEMGKAESLDSIIHERI